MIFDSQVAVLRYRERELLLLLLIIVGMLVEHIHNTYLQ